MKKIIIHDSIFEQYPDFMRGIVVIKDCDIAKSNNRVRKLLKNTIDGRVDLDIDSSPEVIAWNNAHLRFGSSPTDYYPSVKSLLTRIKQGQGLPFINTVVALMNHISLKYVLPCGGDDIAVTTGNLNLMHSQGCERFVPLGEPDKVTHPEKGEVIYADDEGLILCRKWNWRNGDVSKIEITSKQLVMNIDCLPPITKEIGILVRDEFAKLLETHVNAKVYTDYVDISRQVVDIVI